MRRKLVLITLAMVVIAAIGICAFMATAIRHCIINSDEAWVSCHEEMFGITWHDNLDS